MLVDALSAATPVGSEVHAYLEHYPEQGGPPERVGLKTLPFKVGRADSNDQTLFSSVVSKHHAAFIDNGGCYAVRDLESTNGTFVNGARITERLLADGDIVHLGPIEFCFRVTGTHPEAALASRNVGATQALPQSVPHSIIRGTQRLRELIELEAVEMVYQPIVDLRTREIVAYEALARGTHPSLSSSPTGLLQLAEECGMTVALSQLFRRLAVAGADRLPVDNRLFLNIHPRELVDDGFVESLEALKASAPSANPLVLEIAEASVTNVSAMARTRDAFTKLGFEFAYDDFGAGQARLLELTDIPPHYLKLDMAVIKGIEALQPRQDLVKALLSVVRTLGVKVIAEGVETEPSAAMCRELGCHLGQGFLFGRPGPPPAAP